MQQPQTRCNLVSQMTGNSWRRNVGNGAGNTGDDEQKAGGESLLRDDHDQRRESYLSGKEWIAQSNTTSRIFYPPKSSSSSPRAAVDASIPPGFGGDRGGGCPLQVVEGERVGDLRRLPNEDEKDNLKLPASEHETSCERETFDRGGPMTWASSQRVENENKSRFPGKIGTSRSGFPQPVTGRDVILNDKEFERRIDRYSSSREDHQRKGCPTIQSNSGRDFSLTYQEMEGRIDRYANNREDSHRRCGTIPQPDAGREAALAEKEMEGRVDRYASSRDSHSRDGEHVIKSLPSSNYDWRMRDRSTVTKTRSRSPPFFSATTSSQDAGVRFQGAVDITTTKLSPQVSPYSGASSLALESGQDDPSHLSPPKRPRLGWGQGLAKYEKKKVGDGDDASKSSSMTRDEAPTKAEPQADEESPLDRVSTSGSWVTGPTSARALLPEISIGDNLPLSTEGVGPKVELIGSCHDIRRGNSLEGGFTTVSELTGAHSDNSTCKPTVGIGIPGAPQLPPNLVSDQVEAPHPSRYLRLTRESGELASDEQRKISNDESSKATLNSEVVEDLSTWTKEAILLRVEKVEGEIDSVEKELAKVARETEGHLLEKVDCSSIDQGTDSHEVASRTIEILTLNQNAADDPTSACSVPSLPSPSMVDSVLVDPADERIAEEVASLSPCADSPVSSGTEQVHNEELPLLKSSSACSGETDQDGEGDVLKEITNDIPIEEKRQLVGKDLQLKHTTDEVSPSGLEARSMMAYQWSLVYSLIQENRKLAKEAAAPLSNLLSKDASYDRPKFYGSPEDAPVWRENVESHLRNQERMQLRLAERRKLLRFKERILALKYRALKEECQNGLLGTCQRRDRLKAVRRWEVDRRHAAFALTNQKPTLRLRPVLAGSVRTDAAQDDGHVKKKIMVVTPANHLRQDLKMPSMIIDERERCFRRFVNRNGLVEDPLSYEQERKAMNPWTPEEKKVFLDKFTIFNKNFSKIASFLEHKTTADCVQYYYRNQKSEDFEKVRRRQQLKKRRDYSLSGASYLATTTPGNNRSHRDANVTRVQALTLAAYAASRDCSRALRGSSNKAVDKARPVATCDSGNLEHMVVKPGCTRESKSGSTPDPVPLGLSPGSLSAGIPSGSRNFREKLSAKSGSGFVSPSAKGIVPEQHSGSRGMRTTPVQRDNAKSDGEEVDSQWTDTERQLFTDAVAKFGKEFKSISDHVGSKTQTQCKTFFSKTRKKFKLDELVEQLQDSPHLGLGVGGVAMKTESACDEGVENLAELSYPFSVESTGSQGQEGKLPEGPLDKAEINVANGLMLLGQALEAEVAAVPPKVPDLPSSVSPVSSGASFAPPKVSLVPSGALVSSMVTSNVSPVSTKVSIRSKISDLGSRVSFLLPVTSDLASQVSDLPSEASDIPAKDLDLPSKVPDLAAEVSDVPAAVSDVPMEVSDVPTKVSDLLSMVSQSSPKVPDLPLDSSDFLSRDSDMPSDVAELPVTKPGDGAIVAIAAEEHEMVITEGLPEKNRPASLEERKHPEQMVKSEQIDDDPAVADGLTKKQSTMKHEPETLETTTMVLRGQSEKNSGGQLARSTEKSSGVFSLAHPEDNNFSSAVVKAEPIVPLDAGGGCLTGILPPTAQAVSLAVAAPPIIHSGQPRETTSRISGTGEFKPRREPTSWTQEEKEKFSEIIRRHGKDWTLLHENLPAKSLTQIKTYFQNSKAKLGFLPSDGVANITARGASTRKRKAEESDTSSNAGSTGQNPNPKVSSEDISQKVISSSMISMSTNIGTPAVVGDGLGYPHFNQGMGQSGEDSSSVRDIQKIMRRMVAANEYPSQSPVPAGLMPLFQPGALPSPNQQSLLLGGQKPQVMVGHQPQQPSIIPPAVLQQQQQISQMTPSQRQLLSKVVQQLHQQQQLQQQQQQLLQQQQQEQQQQQNPQAVAHQPQQLAHHLQQQVTQLVAQQQQMAHLLQPQLLQHHVQQAIPLASGAHQHPLGSRPKQTVSPQQPQTVHSNRVHHPSSQQQPYLQQQQFLQQQKQLLQQLQQEQLTQHIQFQLQQTQKQIQQQPQLQHLQQLQQLQQLHQQQLQQLRKEHAQLQVHQQQVQQQQVQQKQIHQQVQQQHVQPPLGLFRSPFQGFSADLLRQSEVVEQRNTTSKPGLPREDMQQVQIQRPAQILPQQPVRTSSSETQRLRLGDVKLFGQSLLSQPPPNAGQASIPSSQKLWQPVMAASAGPVAIPSNNLSKVYGKDPLLVPSAFPRASSILSGEGHAQPWPAASTGNLDLWSSVMGGLQGVVLYKSEDAKSELCSVQDAVARMTARLSQKAQEKDCENTGLQHNLEHLESGVAQDLKTKEVAGDVVRGKDVVDVPNETGRERARMEVEWRNDSLQPTSAGSVEAFTRPSPKAGLTSIAKAPVNPSFEVMDAILASADQRSAQVGVSTSGQGVNDEFVQQILSLWRESGNEGMSGSGSVGSSASALKKLLSGSDMSQLLSDGIYAAQPNSLHANFLNMSKSSWASSHGPHATESQVASAGPSFQPGALLRNHTGQEDQSGTSDSKNLETL